MHRRPGVFAGKEGRLKDLDEHECRQAECERAQGPGGVGGVGRTERGPLEQHRDDRFGRYGESDRRRDREDQPELQRAVLAVDDAGTVAGPEPA